MIDETSKITKTKTLDQNEEAKKLSDIDVLKIEKAVEALAKNSQNAYAITLSHNLKMSRSIEEKRKWVVLYYVGCFQLLSFIQMAKNDTRDMENFEEELKKLFKGT